MDSFVDHSAAAVARLSDVSDLDGVDLVVEQRVIDPEGDQIWHLQVTNGSVSIIDGPAEHPDVTLSQDADTATALRSGELHAQHAFLTGRLTIDGDIAKLLEHGDLLQTLFRGTRA